MLCILLWGTYLEYSWSYELINLLMFAATNKTVSWLWSWLLNMDGLTKQSSRRLWPHACIKSLLIFLVWTHGAQLKDAKRQQGTNSPNDYKWLEMGKKLPKRDTWPEIYKQTDTIHPNRWKTTKNRHKMTTDTTTASFASFCTSFGVGILDRRGGGAFFTYLCPGAHSLIIRPC